MQVPRFAFNPLFSTVLGASGLLSACCCENLVPDLFPSQPRVIEGTAAVGAALAQASVSITDTSGGAVCAELALVTTDAGHFPAPCSKAGSPRS